MILELPLYLQLAVIVVKLTNIHLHYFVNPIYIRINLISPFIWALLLKDLVLVLHSIWRVNHGITFSLRVQILQRTH